MTLGSLEWLCMCKTLQEKTVPRVTSHTCKQHYSLAVMGDCIMMVSSSCRIKKMKKGFQEEMAVICLQ